MSIKYNYVIREVITTADTIIQAIQTVGYPIVTALACMWYVKYREDKNDTRLDQLNATHAEEVAALKEALANNTVALTELSTLLREGKT